ncbi:nitroreductase family protein [Oceanispirochaeta sp.]|jgi:nitroreductase|uniref:nitroreductase family protein n=1 Tax=Oceanispirochaeta sp. TaxID=2035350 RepID=UPI0026298F54|nr:nitroreductase family protein [Oceanispirochaeta sp.]MDA3957787.1 nitroreductase family protein [Oceanispirochaeta sp.]
MITELVEKTRSCRRFEQKELPEEFMKSLVETARVCPSARNKQPLKYITIENHDFRNLLFPHLNWAGSLKNWDGPIEGERPTGYVVLILDKRISSSAGLDTGIVAQTMQLVAMEKGIGSCMLGAFIKENVAKLLELGDELEIQLILALGYPLEKRVIVDVKDESDVSYFRDDNQVHYIPKRSLESLLLRKI